LFDDAMSLPCLLAGLHDVLNKLAEIESNVNHQLQELEERKNLSSRSLVAPAASGRNLPQPAAPNAAREASMQRNRTRQNSEFVFVPESDSDSD
jgi:hypothetical protein